MGFEVRAAERGVRSSPCGHAEAAAASSTGQRVPRRAAPAGPWLSGRPSAAPRPFPGSRCPRCSVTRSSGATSRAPSARTHRQSADRALVLMRFQRGAASRLQHCRMILFCVVIPGCVSSSALWASSLTDGGFFPAPLRSLVLMPGFLRIRPSVLTGTSFNILYYFDGVKQ